MNLKQLQDTWTTRAAELRRYSPAAAEAFLAAADELRRVLASDDELVTLAEASRLSGYSADYLGRLIKAGKLENRGRMHAPRILRSDLPKKAPSSTNSRLGTLKQHLALSP